ncbi:NYN domain-containing protein [Candidatus Babeliales bacterium]|nr:NYN domain-containing protein [Candidatus Babeliales bacterium]
MIIIVDGYNLLKKIFVETFISEKQRTAFVNLMGRYSKKRGHKVIIVFDAGPCRYPLTEKDHGVTVIYSGEYQSADDIIMDFVQKHENKDILVVTEDREIIQAVERCHEDALDPRTFYEKVKNAFNVSDEVLKKELSGIIKLSDTENEDLDALMHYAASMNMQVKDDECYTVHDRQKKGQEVKKSQRNRLKKVDKL